MANDLVTLKRGALELQLCPSVGGAIAGLHALAGGRRTPVLRESHAALENVLDTASFPLVPFSNRIRGGRFEFRGTEVRLSRNMDSDPSPLHGQGWTSAWSVAGITDDSATLLFDHEAGEWPWAYQARQLFRLDGDALHMRLDCSNLSSEPMPCGLGMHPYFNCGQDTRIQTAVSEVWTVDEQVLPVERVPASGRYAIADDPVCGRGLDNGYGGWSGRALFTDPGWPFELELSSPGAQYFQLYSPPQGCLFVAEPVTHANAALNEPEADWPSLGIRILEPGETMTLEAALSVRLH